MKKISHAEDRVGNNTQITLSIEGVKPKALNKRTWVCKYHKQYSAGYVYEEEGTKISAHYNSQEAKKLFQTWSSRKLNKDYN